ncbi:type II toxin-antitoxin system RelE/ParE family toxin [Streptomyces sp. NPDC002619]|uniref:type II toxin-antitoxin system RelE/ParE family toxin n=1 Tax=Streptomyces sp. NPDC002619 TaxID=3364655 RepID=UPI0036A23300
MRSSPSSSNPRCGTGWRPCRPSTSSKSTNTFGLLAEHAAALGEPYARYLGDGVRELRPTLDGAAIRITYWLTPNRTAVLLTVFRKTRMREDAEVRRAKLAQKVCEAEHGPAHEEFIRTIEEGEVEQ